MDADQIARYEERQKAGIARAKAAREEGVPKVCPFRLVGHVGEISTALASAPNGRATDAASVACLREQCELWRVTPGASGCGLRLR